MEQLLKQLEAYVCQFNAHDDETYIQKFPNHTALSFLSEQIPLVELPDKDIEENYYFRWWVFRKHIKETEKGHIITEFLPDVPWAGPYNSINCPAGFHIREGRWLKDPDGWLLQYIDFWLQEYGNTHFYSSWYAHALWEYCEIKNDFSAAIERLPALVRLFETREKEHLKSNGLYWSSDNLDGMENSISGPGLRPTMNAYAYGDAVAIAKIAALSGDEATQTRFAQKAKELKQLCDTLLWDQDFYKTIPLQKGEDCTCTRRPTVAPEQDARELVGYLPWYFSMPDKEKETAFSQLFCPEGFSALAGLTTAEQRHPRYMEQTPYECQWNGPVWPFATSYVLVAAANVLKSSKQTVFTKEDYFRLLKQYALCHKHQKDDGMWVNWIDESLHPVTGVWQARQTLKDWGWLPEKGGKERGKDYNHSLFCDLILSGLLGIDVQNGSFVCHPLIPESWDYFRVENLWLGGVCYRIVYDKTGTHYNLGQGLTISPA